jgi:hypothetical protein
VKVFEKPRSGNEEMAGGTLPKLDRCSCQSQSQVNASNGSMRLAMTGRLAHSFVCNSVALQSDFTPVLAKHTKHLSLVDILAVGVDRMQRNFGPIRSSRLSRSKK